MTDGRVEVSIRGVPEWLLRDYLAALGAASDGPPDARRMRGDGWSVAWSLRTAAVAGSRALNLTQIDMVFTGEPAAVEAVSRRFLAKAQRGGG